MPWSTLKQFAIAIDQVFNTLVYFKSDGFGYADETLSARAWRLRHKSNAYKWIDGLFFWQKEHCRASYQSELLRKQLPSEYRNESTIPE